MAIDDTEKRLEMIKKIQEEIPYGLVSLISPEAHISPSVQYGRGCLIEPMAVVHTNCVLMDACIISAGAVVNPFSMCCPGVWLKSNAMVDSSCFVPAGTKIKSGDVYRRKEAIELYDLFFDSKRWKDNQVDISKRTPQMVDGVEYSFDCGM